VDEAKLIKMANQIAANLTYGENRVSAVAGVRDHLRRFWSPTMRQEIIAYYTRGGAELSEVAALAVARLAEESGSTA